MRTAAALVLALALGSFAETEVEAEPDAELQIPEKTNPQWKPITRLTEETFDKAVARSSASTFIMFFAPWCSHCRKFEPTWESIARTVKAEAGNELIIATVDCTVEDHLAKRIGIDGYPKLILFHNGYMYPYTGKREFGPLETFMRGGFKKGSWKYIPSGWTIPIFDFIDGLAKSASHCGESLDALRRCGARRHRVRDRERDSARGRAGAWRRSRDQARDRARDRARNRARDRARG